MVNKVRNVSPLESIEATASLCVGLSGSAHHACAAITDGQEILGVCEQERVTRVRAAGFNATGFPDEALNLLLSRAGKDRSAIRQYIVAEDGLSSTVDKVSPMDRHMAHACASFLSSSLCSAAIVVCDHKSPMVSVWIGNGSEVMPVKWPWRGPGFCELYSSCAKLMNLGGAGDQRFEALARLRPEHREDWLCDEFNTDGTTLHLEDGWETRILDWRQHSTASGITGSSGCAAALQRRISDLLLLFLARVRKVTQSESLCLAGSLFYHSSINTAVRTSDLFDRVFIPVDPSEAGLAVGAALHESRDRSKPLSPFLGPAYTSDEVKATLDNCKVQYIALTESEAVETAVSALRKGQLVGWYEGAMEWGQRALGGRSILANPFAPFVLENLNRFLKHREPWRGYALSALKPAVDRYFDGPTEAPFMECDFRCRDLDTFRSVLPMPEAAVRIHIAGEETPRRFRKVLEAFGATCGIPCVVNTSFNGFHEPIVCSPRDAIRVFYSSGVDLLILDRFLLTK